jgi:hypothetical protein
LRIRVDDVFEFFTKKKKKKKKVAVKEAIEYLPFSKKKMIKPKPKPKLKLKLK